MKLPENAHEFKLHVLDKLSVYCDAKIWPYEFDQFTRWLSNFDCEIEEYLALQLLDNLIVRSREMAVASYERLFSSELRQHLISISIIENISIKKWKENLKLGHLSREIKFVPVNMGESGESGHIVYRMLADILETNRYEYKPDNENLNLKAIIIVDDTLGSGQQFIDFADNFKLNDKLSQYKIVYCPLMACQDGVASLNKKFSDLTILPAELIPVDIHLFSLPLSEKFKKDLINTKADAKFFLEKMKTKYAPNMDNWLGRDDASLCLTYEWGCPNQSLALLYMNHSPKRENWNQLFQRRSM